jgi:prepilin-type N-terminal cleavage/methylation domain-containing protein
MAPPKNKTGFTLVEILLSIALLGMLLTAVAAAMHASFQSYDQNDKLASVTQVARSILDRMTREIRTAIDIDPNSTSTRLGIQPPADSGVQRIEYEYTGGALYYRRTIGGVTTSQALLSPTDDVRVTSFLVLSRETGQDWQGYTCTKNVKIRLDLLVDSQALSLTASGVLRRNQVY